MTTAIESPGSLNSYAARHGVEPRDAATFEAYTRELAAYREACLGGVALLEADNVGQGE